MDLQKLNWFCTVFVPITLHSLLMVCDSQIANPYQTANFILIKNLTSEDMLQVMPGGFDTDHVETEISNYAIDTPIRFALLKDKTMALLEFEDNGKILEKCTLFDLEKELDRIASSAASVGMPIIRCDFKTMMDAINRCKELSANSPVINQIPEQSPSNVTLAENSGSFSPMWKGLIPGTKWCGLGDLANTYDDLGPRRDVDLCCRAHDHCPIRLKAFRIGYGLINLSLYTKSHCACDEDFLNCLKGANSNVATILGNFYFNLLKIQCIKEERTLICVEFRKNQNGHDECLRYEMSNKEIKMKFVSPEMQYPYSN